MGKNKSSPLSLDQRRLVAYALCALVDATPDELRQVVSADCSIVADRLGIAGELVQAIVDHQQAEAAKPAAPGQ